MASARGSSKPPASRSEPDRPGEKVGLRGPGDRGQRPGERPRARRPSRPGGRQDRRREALAPDAALHLLESISLCRKRPFATYGQRRRPASAAVCRIPCRILCLADGQTNEPPRLVGRAHASIGVSR